MSDENGRTKAFELAPVKSPEQIESEGKKKLAPEIRSSVFKMRLPAQVKFFFAALLDATFLYKFGGDGRGRIFTNVTKLSRLFKHDPDSITSWRDRLVREKLVWTSHEWPDQEWRICALYPAPEEYHPRDRDYVLGKAGSLENEQTGNLRQGDFLAKPEASPSVSEEIRTCPPKTSVETTEGFRIPYRRFPDTLPKVSPNMTGNLPDTPPTTPPTPTEGLGKGIRKVSAGSAEDFRPTMESPSRTGDLGDQGGGKGAPPTPPKKAGKTQMDTDAAWEAFAKTLRDQYPSITRKEKDRLVAQRKALMENPASFDLSKSQLKPSSAEWITYADREMARLADSDKPEDRKLLAERQKAKAAILKDPKSYTKLELTAEAEHKLQVLNRKIAMMEEVLTGPAV